MRNRLTLALAPHLGKVLTFEQAQAILAQFPSEEGSALDLDSIELEYAERATCGRLTFRPERLLDIIPAMGKLHQAHWSETEGYRHAMGLNMDYDALVLEERAGTMIQFTARDGQELVGNFRVFLRRDRHTGRRMAHEDTLYLLPEYRKGRNALKFLDYAGAVLRGMGYHVFQAEVKEANPAAGRLLEHRGFKRIPQAAYILIDNEEGDHVRT